jgi:hypothetical protein
MSGTRVVVRAGAGMVKNRYKSRGKVGVERGEQAYGDKDRDENRDRNEDLIRE